MQSWAQCMQIRPGNASSFAKMLQELSSMCCPACALLLHVVTEVGVAAEYQSTQRMHAWAAPQCLRLPSYLMLDAPTEVLSTASEGWLALPEAR